MIVTLQTDMDLHPALSVHGGIIKVDLGALVMEMDIDEFKNIIITLVNQAAAHEIYFKPIF